MVRSSSSTQPASSSEPLRRGPPSAWTNVGGSISWSSRRRASARSTRPVPARTTSTGPRGADRRRRAVLGHDQEPGAAGEQVGAGIDIAASRSRRRCAGRASSAGRSPPGAPWSAPTMMASAARRSAPSTALSVGLPSAPDGRRRRSSRRGWRSCTARPTADPSRRCRATPYSSSIGTSAVGSGSTSRTRPMMARSRRRARDRRARQGADGERGVAHMEIHRVVPYRPTGRVRRFCSRAGCGAARGSLAGPGGDGVGPRGPEPAMPHRAPVRRRCSTPGPSVPGFLGVGC